MATASSCAADSDDHSANDNVDGDILSAHISRLLAAEDCSSADEDDVFGQDDRLQQSWGSSGGGHRDDSQMKTDTMFTVDTLPGIAVAEDYSGGRVEDVNNSGNVNNHYHGSQQSTNLAVVPVEPRPSYLREWNARVISDASAAVARSPLFVTHQDGLRDASDAAKHLTTTAAFAITSVVSSSSLQEQLQMLRAHIEQLEAEREAELQVHKQCYT